MNINFESNLNWVSFSHRFPHCFFINFHYFCHRIANRFLQRKLLPFSHHFRDHIRPLAHLWRPLASLLASFGSFLDELSAPLDSFLVHLASFCWPRGSIFWLSMSHGVIWIILDDHSTPIVSRLVSFGCPLLLTSGLHFSLWELEYFGN